MTKKIKVQSIYRLRSTNCNKNYVWSIRTGRMQRETCILKEFLYLNIQPTKVITILSSVSVSQTISYLSLYGDSAWLCLRVTQSSLDFFLNFHSVSCTSLPDEAEILKGFQPLLSQWLKDINVSLPRRFTKILTLLVRFSVYVSMTVALSTISE